MSTNEKTRLPAGESIPLLSFFTGAGFLDLGFLQHRFEIIWHNENKPAFVYAFETGLRSMGYEGVSSTIQNTNSIIDVGPNEIAAGAFKGGQPPSLFGIIGGPPCPDFSVGGKNRGRLGGQGRLSEVFVNRIVEMGPTFFVYENVPGLLKTAKHRAFLVSLLDRLADRYALDLRMLNALDFGVPQDRERLLIVGFRKQWLMRNFPTAAYKRVIDASAFVPFLVRTPPKSLFAYIEHWFPWPEIPEYSGAKYKFDWPIEPIAAGQQPVKPDCPDALMAGTYVCDDRRLGLANSGEAFKPKSGKFHQIREGDVSRKSFKRLHRYRYSPAAAYGNNEVHLHPTLPRRLTVREAMMIQSVPDQYVLPADMSLSDKFKTVGNGVPVKLAAAIAGAVANFIRGECYASL